MKYKECCDTFKYHINAKCLDHKKKWDCPDMVLIEGKTELLLPIRDGGKSGIAIKYCPWCGKRIAKLKSKKV